MKKTLLILLLIPAVCLGQDWGKFKPVANKNEQFGQAIKKWGVVLCLADTSWYIITDLASSTDSLQTFLRQGKYYRNSSGDNADSKWESVGSDIYYSAGKVSIGSSSPPDSTLEVTGGVKVTRGVKTGYDVVINGVRVGARPNGKNTILGNSAGNSTTGFSNTAIGVRALYSNTTASNLVAVGDSALYSNTTGGQNTAVGSKALRKNTTASSSTAFGYMALTNSTGANNTGIGNEALYTNTTGTMNTAIGDGALKLQSTATRNTAVGFGSLYSSTGGANTAVGSLTLRSNTTGQSNIAIGDSAGYAYTTLSNRMYLGARDTTGTTGGIYFDRTPAKRWGKWMGTMKITNIPADGSPDSVLTVVDGLIKRAAFPSGTTYTATSPMSVAGDDIHILADTLADWHTKQNKGATAYSWGDPYGVYEPIIDPVPIAPGNYYAKHDGAGSTSWEAFPTIPAAYDTTTNPWKYLSGNTVQRGTGNVGIGTTNPTALLFIENASQGAIIRNNSTVSIPAGSGTYNLSQLDLLHNGTTGVFARQVLRYNRTTSRYEFMQSFRNAAGGALNVQYLDLDNGSYQIQSGVTNMDFQNTGNVTFSNSGSVGIATTSPSTYLDINGNKFRLRTAKTPSSSTDTGNAGDICWDASYIYICTATNTWKRVAISTW